MDILARISGERLGLFHSLVWRNQSQQAFLLILAVLCSCNWVGFCVIPTGLGVNHASPYHAERALCSAVYPTSIQKVEHVRRRTERIHKGQLCPNMCNQAKKEIEKRDILHILYDYIAVYVSGICSGLNGAGTSGPFFFLISLHKDKYTRFTYYANFWQVCFIAHMGIWLDLQAVSKMIACFMITYKEQKYRDSHSWFCSNRFYNFN